VSTDGTDPTALDWLNAFGIIRLWEITPSSLKLGTQIETSMIPTNQLPSLVMKSLLFFVLALHMRMISSNEYKKYVLNSSLEKEET
jgi:hypothetical protein